MKYYVITGLTVLLISLVATLVVSLFYWGLVFLGTGSWLSGSLCFGAIVGTVALSVMILDSRD